MKYFLFINVYLKKDKLIFNRTCSLQSRKKPISVIWKKLMIS